MLHQILMEAMPEGFIKQIGNRKQFAYPTISDVVGLSDALAADSDAIESAITEHESETDPHSQYATDSDLVSGLAGKAAIGVAESLIANHTQASNPHGTTATQVGADPIGTAALALTNHLSAYPHDQFTTDTEVNVLIAGTIANFTEALAQTIFTLQAAIDAKANLIHTQAISTITGLNDALDNKSAINHRHSNATDSASGFLAPTDKLKLDSISANATANATNAQLRDRTTHTGTQEIATVSGLGTALDSKALSNDPRLSDQRTPIDGSVTNGKVATDAEIAWGKISKVGANPGDVNAATALQGSKADSALQPAAIGVTITAFDDPRLDAPHVPTAHTQPFSTITDTPTTRLGYGITDAASADQGATADSALQPGEIGQLVQAFSGELVTISALAPINGQFLRRDAGAWQSAALVAGDIPSLDSDKITSGIFNNARIDWANPGPVGATTRNTIAGTTISASGALTATASAKVSGVGGSFNAAIETQPTSYGQAHFALLDPSSPGANPALRLIQTGLRAYQMALSSGGAGSFTFTNLSSGGFTTTFQSNQNAVSLPLTLANLNAGLDQGAQFNFQLGDGTTLYNSGGIAYRQESAFTNTPATNNAIVTLSSLTAGNATEKLRVLSSGRMLLGTTIDDGVSRLQVSGAIAAKNINSTGTRIGLAPTSAPTGGGFRYDYTAGASIPLVSVGPSSNIQFGHGASGMASAGLWNSGGSLGLQYDVVAGTAQGNVLIGTATNDGVNKLQVAGSGLFTGVLKTTDTTASVGLTSGSIVAGGGAAINGAINTPGLLITATGAVQTIGVGGGSVAGATRGTNAVDLQSLRNAANKVASGTNATISGGSHNTASGVATVVSGGSQNQATAQNAVVVGGDLNVASGSYATVAGGNQNTASATYAMVGGRNGLANRFGQFAFGGLSVNAGSANSGDTQYSLLIANAKSTDATPKELFLDANTASQRITIANNASLAYDICISAHCTTDRTKQAQFWRRGKVYKLTTAASTAIVAGEIADNQVGALPWSATVSADTTNGSLKISVVGEAGLTINWVATVQAVEIAG